MRRILTGKEKKLAEICSNLHRSVSPHVLHVYINVYIDSSGRAIHAKRRLSVAVPDINTSWQLRH